MLNMLKEYCCGCGACMNICPKQCIEMLLNDEGFLEPHVNDQDCVQCGLCDQVCPVQNTHIKSSQGKAYMAYDLDEKRREAASSGGVFFLLASAVINKQGIVYGVICDEQLNVVHRRAETIEEIYPFRGSKYVQSNTAFTYQQVFQDLKNGKEVLYSGTPCQIAGLLKFLERKKLDCSDMGKLFTVDTLCHGVPSLKTLHAYVREVEEQENIIVKKVRFRDKRTGWQNYSIVLETSEGEKSCDANHDAYMLAFRRDLSLRQSCYNCKFKLGKKEIWSDLTLGDFWGVGREFHEYADDDKGISWITVHSQKGARWFAEIEEQLYIREVDISIPLRNNTSASKPAIKPKRRDRFFSDVNSGKEFSKTTMICAGETGIEGLIRKTKRILKKAY